jgi:ribulose-phosphate 3-epimerase
MNTVRLPKKDIKISPSLMCADFLHLQEQLTIFEEREIEYLHIDIMDGHYVPNFTLGPGFCKVLSEGCSIPLDVHLMIENVDKYIPVFAEAILAGADRHPSVKNSVIAFQVEAEYHPLRQLHLIKSFGLRAGIAIDPATPLESIRHVLPDTDLLCVMTVNPGYSGQKLIPHSLDKMREIAEFCVKEGYPVEIEVDGNVSWENIPRMIEAGAETLVAGTSSLFERGKDLRGNVEKMRNLISRVQSEERAV